MPTVRECVRVTGRVETLAGQQQTQRAPDRQSTPEHDHVPSRDRHVVALQQLDDARRGAGQRGRDRTVDAEDQPAQVHRMQPIRILVGVDEFEHRVLVDPGRQRQLHDASR